jgi:hypothetical protein
MGSLIDLVVQAESIGQLTGEMKKDWVLSKLNGTMDKNTASLLIDDIVSVLNCPQTVKLFNDSSAICVQWCCRKYQ